MDKFVIQGGTQLNGTISVSGAKNGSLALMPATLLAPGTYHLTNTPNLRDVWTMSRLMGSLGAFCELNGNDLFLDTRNIHTFEAPYEHVKKMRASFYVLGPLVARYGMAKVSLPGGCAWGPRPVDLHLKGLEKLGAEIELEQGYVLAKSDKLRGGKVHFDISSVGATGNVLMAATLAKGGTLITNAALEPEITALARMLCKMGAKIDGIGTTQLEIQGVDELKPVDEETIPDRIEAATFLIAAAMTKGKIQLNKTNPYHLTAVIAKLEESGAEIDVNSDTITLEMNEKPIPTDIITAVYPGIPTDIQAQWTAYMLAAEGNTKVTDNIYKDRFKHVPELVRLNADIDIIDNAAIVKGGQILKGAQVMSSDLRGSACLVLAALIAEGTTELFRIYHLDRGYEDLEKKLNSLGANIRREKTDIV
ncbi:MAG: UDP-N-acetylglucosamine 1-carboxyvinyltransferase [Candidatus Kapabacteria bacterium]|nr:UDP-N-acetylglucosamine 1-carboxyvinyltransferase [Ignavibacteriota bacterium]MCW5883925.1 UDP-N-acetylglucosamine 1-carboxyvinyltransferase [Candidatus Kapabacteria bacterium]